MRFTNFLETITCTPFEIEKNVFILFALRIVKIFQIMSILVVYLSETITQNTDYKQVITDHLEIIDQEVALKPPTFWNI